MILVGETVVLLDDGSGNYIGGAEVAQAPAVEEEKQHQSLVSFQYLQMLLNQVMKV